MNLQSRERRLALLAAVVIGLVLIDRVFFSPWLEGWRQASEDLAAAQQELEKSDAYLDREPFLQDRWRDYEHALAQVDRENAVPAFLDHLQTLAERAGLAVKDIRPVRVREHDGFEEIQFEAKTECTIQTLTRFLYELDQSTEFLRVSSLSVVADDEGATLRVLLRLSTVTPIGEGA